MRSSTKQTDTPSVIYTSHIDGLRFRLFSDGTCYVGLRREDPEKDEFTFTLRCSDTNTPWIPSQRNFNRTCKWGIRESDYKHLFRRKEREDKARKRKRDAAEDLYDALDEAEKDLVAYQVNALKAAKYDPLWSGVAEEIQPRIDAARAALSKARGEQKR